MTDKRVESWGGRPMEWRSYYDHDLKQHFALLPPGDDELSRIAIPVSVCDMNEDQLCLLWSIYSRVQEAQRKKWGHAPVSNGVGR